VAAPVRLLDLDGTLVLTHAAYARCLSGGSQAKADSLVAALRNGASVVTLAKRAGVSRATLVNSLHAGSVTLVDNWATTLGELRTRGHPVGVVTSLPGWLSRPLLEATGIADVLDVLVDASVTRVAKPNPTPLLIAFDRLARTPSRDDLYVGDTAADAAAASAAGIGFIWAPWGYGAMPADAPRLGSPSDLLDR
jgi:phosphoglycolate phosphatase-like HAD superfamily hydrolase